MKLNSLKTATLLIPFVGITKLFDTSNYKSSVASDRLQIHPLLKALEKLNFKTNALSINVNHSLEELELIKAVDVCIISKIRSHSNVDKEKFAYFHSCCALKMKRLGAKLLTIYSDNVCASNDSDCELYKNLLFLSDTIITPSKRLKDHASKYSTNSANIFTINDPNQLRQRPFRKIDKNQIIKIIWFGNFSNLKYLISALESIDNKLTRLNSINLRIITSKIGIKYCESNLTHLLPRLKWSIRLLEWDIHNQPQQIESELDKAHIALIPSDPNDPLKDGVSHNRLIDAIQSGCISIASPMESYYELSKIALIGNNFSELLEKAILENTRLCEKYDSLREKHLARFSTNSNIQNWSKAIEATLRQT